jgi:site-specific recombinase XerD
MRVPGSAPSHSKQTEPVLCNLRHCCALYLAINGASLVETAKVLGHKTLQMVKRSAHCVEVQTAQVVARMTAAIFS